MPYWLWCPSFQSMWMPLDLEMAICSGSVARGMSVVKTLDVAHSGNAAHGGHQFFELLFVAHVDGHFHHAAALIAGGFRFQAANVRVFVGEHGGELGQH